ncbi:glucose repression mediator protein [Coemansia spiralis]|uniref:Glucose repression mediator protein n=1 Tax=Coemansia spiralis TaxID=417178 RepID=A0A9W8KY65_9FUNG|nr:glucose repression mediator protein [Coemansia spiralis]
MQAHHQPPQRPFTPGQNRQPPPQSMNPGMPPSNMHVSTQMGPPQPTSNGQSSGSYQQMPPRSIPPHQAQLGRQPRQPMQSQHAGPPPPHPSGLQQQPQQQPQMPPSSAQQPQQPQQPHPPLQPQPQPQQTMPPIPGSQMPPPSQQQQPQQPATAAQKLSSMTEDVWMQIGSLSEFMNESERALAAYENALRHNPYSQAALSQIANIYRGREDFEKAVEYFQRIVNIDSANGETWGAIGNCYLMLDELPKAYQAYQQAIMHLHNPKEPKLWYGIGILYDRYGSYEHAEEAFDAVMNMDPNFDKATEIYFRLGIIHKCQGKYAQSLDCFNRILSDPPKPLTETDIWFQIGNVHELNGEFILARDAYDRVLRENPQHGKVLQQLGALYFRPNTSLTNIDAAVQLLTRAIEVDKDKTEAQTWYLLGRCYMVQTQYNKAYEAYQQAVYRDGNNANYWCSIGVLYFQINQYRDALDAYSRAIRINPFLSEVWFDLGALYEACNNQVNDAIDAYTRAAELDRSNPVTEQRLELLRNMQSTGQTNLSQASQPPPPIDPPTTTTTTGQPNAPGGPAGESTATGGAPGSLGAPPMSGAVNNVPQPHGHTHHPSDAIQHSAAQRGGGPVPPGMQRPSNAASQQYAQPSKAPYQQAPGGRPGYPEEQSYGRYESVPRPENAGPEMQAPPPHYTGMPPQSSSAYSASAPYASASHPHQQSMTQQPQTSRPYTGSSHHPQASAPYTSQPQQTSSGPYRSEDVHMNSRQQSPMVAQQLPHQQQGHYRPHQQSSNAPQHTPSATEQSPATSTFQQGPINGYGQYPNQQDYADARNSAHSPSQIQSPVHHRHQHKQQSTQPQQQYSERNRSISQGEKHTTQPFDQHGVDNGTDRSAFGKYRPSKDAGKLSGDNDGDIVMEDAHPSSTYGPSSLRDEAGASSLSAEASVAATMAVMSAAPINLPQITTPVPTSSDNSASSNSTSALSGQTAAPIRLPPVQVGNTGGLSSTGNQQTAGVSGDATRADSSGSSVAPSASDRHTSLASVMSNAEEDKEGSAINSLMSLSSVATTMTSRPHVSSPHHALPGFARKSSTESSTAAGGPEPQSQPRTSSVPSVSEINGVKDLEISSPNDVKSTVGDGEPAEEVESRAASISAGEGNAKAGTASPSIITSDAGLSTVPALSSSSNSGGDGNNYNAEAGMSSSGSSSENVAAIVPSKRPLTAEVTTAAGAGDATTAAQSDLPDSTDDIGDTSATREGSDRPENGNSNNSNGNNDDVNGGGSNGNSSLGPRKRGRQESPLSASGKQQSRHSSASPKDDMEEGEMPEDGEVLEDEEGGTHNERGKPHKGDDVVMDSGKV